MSKENYIGLKENLKRLKNEISNKKTELLFKIAYKLGYNSGLSERNYDKNIEECDHEEVVEIFERYQCSDCGELFIDKEDAND